MLKENKEEWQLNVMHDIGMGLLATKNIIGTNDKTWVNYSNTSIIVMVAMWLF